MAKIAETEITFVFPDMSEVTYADFETFAPCELSKVQIEGVRYRVKEVEHIFVTTSGSNAKHVIKAEVELWPGE